MLKGFLKNSLFFGIIVIFSGILFTILIVEINRKLFGKIEIDKEITTIIVGDSHTACAVNDSLMSKTLNVSLLSETYFFSYLKLENILNNNENIKNVILGFSYHNLSSNYERFVYGTPVFNSVNRYISIMGLKDYFTLLSKQSSVTNLIPIIKSSLNNILKYAGKANPCILKDKIPQISGGADIKSITSRIDFLYYSEPDPCKVSDFNVFYLKKIVELCRIRDVNLILINTPLFEGFYSDIPVCKKSEYDNIVKDLDVPFLNLNNVVLPGNCFFPDGDHTNSNGAKLVTQYLNENLKYLQQ